MFPHSAKYTFFSFLQVALPTKADCLLPSHVTCYVETRRREVFEIDSITTNRRGLIPHRPSRPNTGQQPLIAGTKARTKENKVLDFFVRFSWREQSHTTPRSSPIRSFTFHSRLPLPFDDLGLGPLTRYIQIKQVLITTGGKSNPLTLG